MPRMVSLVPVRVASLTGHVVLVGPDGADVPDILVDEAKQHGCALESDITPTFGLSAARRVPKEDIEIDVTGGGRRQLLEQALARIVERNNPGEFTAAGQPRVSAMRREMGGDVSFEEIQSLTFGLPVRD
jgi:hypothetical protein